MRNPKVFRWSEYCGHGIGRSFHEDPQVLHYGTHGEGIEIVPGMTFTIEPMVNAGKAQTRLLSDGWTVVTKDHSLSAQWEHTLAVTDTGVEVLTGSPDASRLKTEDLAMPQRALRLRFDEKAADSVEQCRAQLEEARRPACRPHTTRRFVRAAC